MRWRTPSFGAARRRCRSAPRYRCSCPSRWPRSCGPPRNRPPQQQAQQAQQPAAAAADAACRTPQRAWVGHAAAAHHHRRLATDAERPSVQQRGHARRAQHPRVRAHLVERDRAQRRPRRGRHPFEADLDAGAPDRRWLRPRPSGRPDPPAVRTSARRSRRPPPSRRAAPAIARPRNGSAHRPATPGSRPASARWLRPGRRGAARPRSAGSQRRGRGVGAPVQAGRAASTATTCAGMGQRPRGGDRGADRHPADGDRRPPRGVVERIEVAVDEPVRLRRRRHDDRADIVQSGGKRPVDVVVVGSGAGQQNRRDTAQIDRHHTIVPCGIDSSARRPGPAWHIGTKRSTVALVG